MSDEELFYFNLAHTTRYAWSELKLKRRFFHKSFIELNQRGAIYKIFKMQTEMPF